MAAVLRDSAAILERLSGYDWEQVFACAGEELKETTAYNEPSISRALGSTVSDKGFARTDIAALHGAEDGENDGANWIAWGQLHDRRWFFVSAGCDYTGWDCRSGGSATVADTRADLILYGMGEDERARFGLKVPS